MQQTWHAIRKVLVLSLIVFLSYVPRIYVNFQYGSLDSRRLISTATSNPKDFKITPFTFDNLIHPDIVLYFLKNFGFPYSIKPKIGGDISIISWVGRSLDEDAETRNRAFELLDYYIDRGESLNRVSSFGLAPVHEAILYREPEYLEVLLKSGANPNIRINAPDKRFHLNNAYEFFKNHVRIKGSKNDKKLNDIDALLAKYFA